MSHIGEHLSCQMEAYGIGFVEGGVEIMEGRLNEEYLHVFSSRSLF
jgi:hypothetical protein